MSDFTIEQEISAEPSIVFDYIADAERTPEWYEAVRSALKVTDGPVEKGTRFRFTRRLPQGEVTNDVEVAEFDRPSTVAFASVSGPTPFTYRYRVAGDEGHCRVILEGSISGDGLRGPAALLAPLASKFFARGMVKNLDTLKRRIESL